MYARLTTFDSNDIDTLIANAERMRDAFRNIPGLNSMRAYTNADGSGVLVAGYASQAEAEAAADISRQIWSQFAVLLKAPPESKTFPTETVFV